MLKALESVASVMLMIGLGFFLAKRGWFDDKSRGLIARLVISVALPASMVANLMGSYDRAELVTMARGLPIPFAVMLACYAIAFVLARIARLPEGRRGTFLSLCALSNTIFIGLPVNVILFGDESMPYVLMYYITNTVLFWTLGVYGIAMDGARLKGGKAAPLVSVEGLRRILSPPLLAILIASALIMAGLKLPAFLLGSFKTIGSMTTPLSMLFIGITLAAVKREKARLDVSILMVAAMRFLVSPLVLILVVRGMDLPPLMKEVFLIQSTMPAMTQIPILAAAYSADSEYAGIVTSITTAASMATIPIFMAAAGYVF
jgi:predicted permease